MNGENIRTVPDADLDRMEDLMRDDAPDPDNKLLSDSDLKQMKRTPQAKVIRRALENPRRSGMRRDSGDFSKDIL